MGVSDSLKNCWNSFYSCLCPCVKESKDEDKVPLRSVWEDWETHRNWRSSFKPHPGDKDWDQLPDSIKAAVKRTSEELNRYTAGRNSMFGNDERASLLKN